MVIKKFFLLVVLLIGLFSFTSNNVFACEDTVDPNQSVSNSNEQTDCPESEQDYVGKDLDLKKGEFGITSVTEDGSGLPDDKADPMVQSGTNDENKKTNNFFPYVIGQIVLIAMVIGLLSLRKKKKI